MNRRLATIGGAGGLLSGLLGVGGGLIMVPLLVLWAGYKQRDAHAMSLAAIIPISFASVLTFGAAGEVRVGYAVALTVGSIVGARLGAGALTRIDERRTEDTAAGHSRSAIRVDRPVIPGTTG